MLQVNPKRMPRTVLIPGILMAAGVFAIYFDIDSATADRRTPTRPEGNARLARVVPLTSNPEAPLNIVELPSVQGVPVNARLPNSHRGSDESNSVDSMPSDRPLLSADEVPRLLRAEIIDPWRQYAWPKHRIMSRAGPRISVKPTFDLDAQPMAGAFLGMVTLERYREKQELPFVIDRQTRVVHVFANHRWQTSAQWMAVNSDEAKPSVRELRDLRPTMMTE